MKNKIVVSVLTAVIVFYTNICAFVTSDLFNRNKSDMSFCGSGEVTAQSETIYYSRKETEEYKIKSEVPAYFGGSGTGCANIAGAVIIGYYDRFCEDLIPNYKTYTKIGSYVKYKVISTEVQNTIAELKELMGTDKNTSGTTFSGYQQGMRAYVNNHNYSYSTEDLGKLDLAKYKAAVQSDKPVAIFLSTHSMLTSIQDNGTYEVIKSDYNTVAHVVVGFGYKIDTYYNSSNEVVATRTYLKIASGLIQYGGDGITYLCLDGKSKVEFAIATEIS